MELIENNDPLNLFKGIKEYNTCEDCGKKIPIYLKKCYNCFWGI